MTIVDSARHVVGGVDTHRDVNVAAVVDMNGGLLGVESFPTTSDGHRCLSSWMSGFGMIERVGVEGTGAYGAGLARHLAVAGVIVIEVDRPDRQKRRRHGKSDELDAVEAARGALSGRCQGRAKSADAHAEALRALLVAKRSARSTRIRTIVQLRHLRFTAPDELRARLGGLTTTQLVNEAAKLRPRPGGDVALHGTKTAAVILARRVHALDAELGVLDEQIGPLVKAAAPELVDIYGVGVDTAAVLLVTAGDNAERISSEGAWAMLCGIAPIPATSGIIDNRFRLNNAGDRHANNAIWRIVITRLGQHEPRTVAYMNRRLAEGKSKRYIIRCLIGRESTVQAVRSVRRERRGTASMSCHVMACLSWSPLPLPGRVIGARELPLGGPNNEEPTVGPAPAAMSDLEVNNVLWMGLGIDTPRCVRHRRPRHGG